MKKVFFVLSFLFLLVACAKEDLPPSPPPPGGDVSVGRAIGGYPISSSLPDWAVAMWNTDISPTAVNFGDNITVSVRNAGYVYKYIYVLNKFRQWERVPIDVSLSDSTVDVWVKGKAVFNLPVSSERLAEGPVYVLSYSCSDTFKKDSEGNKIWDCNKFSNLWSIGSFVIEVKRFSELIEDNIENNIYVNSSVEETSDGTMYTAGYSHRYTGVRTDVSVVELSDFSSFWTMLRTNLPVFSSQWNVRSPQICGFLSKDNSKFSWLSNYSNKYYWISVKTYGPVDDAKITAYMKYHYSTDCDLLDKLSLPVCGDNVTEGDEQCDDGNLLSNDGCSKNCTLEICGDLILQSDEQCEPPLFNCSANYYCDECLCIEEPPVCGDEIINGDEECEFDENCSEGMVCSECICVEEQSVCGDNVINQASEQCEPPGGSCSKVISLPFGGSSTLYGTCSNSCRCIVCNDGIKESPETCDCGPLDMTGGICGCSGTKRCVNCVCKDPFVLN